MTWRNFLPDVGRKKEAAVLVSAPDPLLGQRLRDAANELIRSYNRRTRRERGWYRQTFRDAELRSTYKYLPERNARRTRRAELI